MSWAIAGALAASTVASLLYSNYASNKSNAYNSAEAEKERDWQEYMSNTAYQRQVADMKAAGINPMVSGLNTSGASTGSAGVASSNTTTNASAGDIAGAASNVLNAISNAENAETNEAAMTSQASLNSTQEQVNIAETSLKASQQVNTDVNTMLQKGMISKTEAETLTQYALQQEIAANTALANARVRTEMNRPDEVLARTGFYEKMSENIGEQIPYTAGEAQSRIVHNFTSGIGNSASVAGDLLGTLERGQADSKAEDVISKAEKKAAERHAKEEFERNHPGFKYNRNRHYGGRRR